MAFTQFNSAGAKTLAAEVVRELNDLADRHGLDINGAGGQLGQNEMTLKFKFRTTDTDAIEAVEKRNFGFSCRHVGLEPDDYGAEFKYNGSHFRLTGVKSSRPKYPISATDIHTKRSYKLPAAAAQAVIAARSVRAAEEAKRTALTGKRTEEEAQFEGEWA